MDGEQITPRSPVQNSLVASREFDGHLLHQEPYFRDTHRDTIYVPYRYTPLPWSPGESDSCRLDTTQYLTLKVVPDIAIQQLQALTLAAEYLFPKGTNQPLTGQD
ncbi:hypothetical protein AVEN_256661-1 [Araneus ventricosus]|uniref:Uncharacterized protein n=1 Tax=Araneus ventricosus TaxID=182803 RepID=A0A4Y2RKX1_ARAVE|nr:hypothetical protein AVEN_256661-1 [Araneus ventricosus]